MAEVRRKVGLGGEGADGVIRWGQAGAVGDASGGRAVTGPPEVCSWRRRREAPGGSHSGSLTCRVVVQRPQFLRQEELDFIEEPVVGGPQAPGAGG